MRPSINRGLVGAGLIAACALTVQNARADMVLGYQETGPAQITGSGTVNVPTGASTTYSDTFSAPTTAITLAPSYGFYDDFLFTVGTGTVDTVATTISLSPNAQINNLQVRLYSTTGNPTLPVLGAPVNGVEGWTQQLNFSPSTTVSNSWLTPQNLTAGTYVLEVRGNVVGTSGGSYSGVLNLTPVPLPAGMPLLLSGLSFFGTLLRRRRAA